MDLDKVVKKIQSDNEKTRFVEFAKLKTYMKTFQDKEVWTNKISRKVFLIYLYTQKIICLLLTMS